MHVCLCVCVSVVKVLTHLVFDGGADVPDRGEVLMLKLCRQPFTFVEDTSWAVGGEKMKS